MAVRILTLLNLVEISVSHGGEYKDDCLPMSGDDDGDSKHP
jgi:hypothetical protein